MHLVGASVHFRRLMGFVLLIVLVICVVFLNFVLFVFELCLVYPMSPISLDCLFLVAPSVSLTFIYPNQSMVVSNKDH